MFNFNEILAPNCFLVVCGGLISSEISALNCVFDWVRISKFKIIYLCSWEPGKFTLISMGPIRFSYGLISGPYEPISTEWVAEVFHHALSIFGIQNAEMQESFFFSFVTSLLRYSIGFI